MLAVMQRRTLVSVIVGAVAGLGALGTLVASEWPDLSPFTIGVLMTVASGLLVMVPSPLVKGPK